jgi:hypothetical protein
MIKFKDLSWFLKLLVVLYSIDCVIGFIQGFIYGFFLW